MTVLKERTSYEVATHLFNLLPIRDSPEPPAPIGIKALYNAVKRTNHTVRKTQKVSQASDDRKFWKQARMGYCCQLHVRLGRRLPERAILKLENIAEAFNYEHLKAKGLHIESIFGAAYWDEIHLEQVVGEGRESSITFVRNEDGIYDENNGNDENEKVMNRRIS